MRAAVINRTRSGAEEGAEEGWVRTIAPERPTHSDPAKSTRLRVPVLMSSSSSTVFSFMKILRVKME